MTPPRALLPVLHKWSVEIRTASVDLRDKIAVADAILPPPTAVPSDPAVTATVLGFTATTVTVRLAGGAPGGRYVVRVAAPTTHGDLIEHDLAVEVWGEG